MKFAFAPISISLAAVLLTACIGETAIPSQTQSGSSLLPQDYTEATPGTGEILTTLLPDGTLQVGKTGAPLLLTLITNHSCAYCQEFQDDSWPRLREDFIDTGLINVDIVILRLRKYPETALFSKALVCAAKQEKGLQMHAALFTVTERDRTAIGTLAESMGLDMLAFSACLDDISLDESLAVRQETLRQQNITLVPTLLLKTEIMTGLPTYADLRGKLEQALQEEQ
jgi:protein-disulfide isomerase